MTKRLKKSYTTMSVPYRVYVLGLGVAPGGILDAY